jgi:hypothetical protein
MNPLTQRARENREQLRRENNAIAWGCGLIGSTLFILFLLGLK